MQAKLAIQNYFTSLEYQTLIALTSATSYGLSVSYQFNENLALEGGYVHIGKFSQSFDTSVCIGCTVAHSEEISAFKLAIIGLLPPANHFSLFGKLGLNFSRRSGTHQVILGPSQFSDNSGGLLIGFGAKYDINQSLSIRTQLETQGVKGEFRRVDTLSVGLIFQ